MERLKSRRAIVLAAWRMEISEPMQLRMKPRNLVDSNAGNQRTTSYNYNTMRNSVSIFIQDYEGSQKKGQLRMRATFFV